MTSLLDIGPLTTKVTIRGTEIEVSGISAIGVFELLRDIPELRMLMAQKNMSEENAASLISQLPHAVGAIIAAATGHLGDKEHIAAALKLSAGEQVEFISAIVPLTFPKGLKSFLDGLFALAPADLGAPGWAQATKSQEPSKDVSVQATTSATAGTTPPDNSQDGAT